METVTENSTAYLTATFKDKDGVPQVPVSITYQIDNLEADGSLTEVKASAAFTPPASSIEIKILPSENAILDQSKRVERRKVTVVATYSVSDVITGFYNYELLNLLALT